MPPTLPLYRRISPCRNYLTPTLLLLLLLPLLSINIICVSGLAARRSVVQSAPPVPTQLPGEFIKRLLDARQGMSPFVMPLLSQNPEKRPLCMKTLDEFRGKTGATTHLQYLKSALIIINQVDRAEFRKTISVGVDKALKRLLDRFFTEATNLQQVLPLIRIMKSCAVDSDGRTMFMKLIMDGLVPALDTQLVRQLRDGLNLITLRDRQGNNIFHLSCMSGNAQVVEKALKFLEDSYANKGPEDHAEAVIAVLNAKNIADMRPLDIANEQHHADISTLLKESYGVAEILIKLKSMAGASGMPQQQIHSASPPAIMSQQQIRSAVPQSSVTQLPVGSAPRPASVPQLPVGSAPPPASVPQLPVGSAPAIMSQQQIRSAVPQSSVPQLPVGSAPPTASMPHRVSSAQPHSMASKPHSAATFAPSSALQQVNSHGALQSQHTSTMPSNSIKSVVKSSSQKPKSSLPSAPPA